VSRTSTCRSTSMEHYREIIAASPTLVERFVRAANDLTDRRLGLDKGRYPIQMCVGAQRKKRGAQTPESLCSKQRTLRESAGERNRTSAHAV
jgi:hypothetical protein